MTHTILLKHILRWLAMSSGLANARIELRKAGLAKIKPDHQKAIGVNNVFTTYYTIPASVLAASGSMGIISALKAPLVFLFD